MPTSARNCWIASFMAIGCIWLEPEGEMIAFTSSGFALE